MAATNEGLRERRRSQTRREIHTAALRLVREYGFDKITVEMISAEAGVSPRTFFNYFPNKEAAVLPGPAKLPPELVEEFVAVGTAPHQEVLADLIRLLVRHLTDDVPQREEIQAAFVLTHSHPALLGAMLGRIAGFERSAAEAVAERLGQQPEDESPTLIAGLALTVLRTGLDRWASQESLDREDDSPVPYVERSAELLRALLAS